jgi:hypothetical protein
MWQRKPKAEPRLVTFAGDVRVDANSPKWLQRIVEHHAPIATTHGGSLEKKPTSWLLIGDQPPETGPGRMLVAGWPVG